MTAGIVVSLTELIALKRYAQTLHYHMKHYAVRSGGHLAKARGRGMDFDEVRHYQAGDEIRHMEWRVTARTGRPHVKVYQEERERPVILFVDFSPSMYFGTRVAFKSAVAARLSALIAWMTIKQSDRVGGILCSASSHQEFIPRSRDAGVLSLLNALSLYTQPQAPHSVVGSSVFSEGIQRLRRVVKPGSLIVLISDFYQMDDDCLKTLQRLRAHADILAYHICDPLELNPPVPAHYALTNGQQALLLNTKSFKVAQAYQEWCQNTQARLRSQFKQMGSPYCQVTALDDLSRVAMTTFPRRKDG